jgi:hypothetical protein
MTKAERIKLLEERVKVLELALRKSCNDQHDEEPLYDLYIDLATEELQSQDQAEEATRRG